MTLHMVLDRQKCFVNSSIPLPEPSIANAYPSKVNYLIDILQEILLHYETVVFTKNDDKRILFFY